MSRGLWFVAGAGAGAYAAFRGRRAAQALTVDGLTDRINGLVVGARLFRDEVAQGYVERQTQLRGGPEVPPHGAEGKHRLSLAPDTPQIEPRVTTQVTAPASPTTDEHEEGTS